MGSLNLKLKSSTCSSLLLWSAALLWPLPSPRLRLMLMPSMVLTAMVLVDFMEDMDTLVLALPDTDMLLLMPMVLTMARGLLMLSPRLMPTMVLTVLDTAMVVSMEVMESVPMVPTPMPMVPTTARGLLMLSPRLMPTMALMVLAMLVLDMAMVVSMEDMESVPMAPTPMLMVSTESRLLSVLILIVLSYCEPKAQK